MKNRLIFLLIFLIPIFGYSTLRSNLDMEDSLQSQKTAVAGVLKRTENGEFCGIVLKKGYGMSEDLILPYSSLLRIADVEESEAAHSYVNSMYDPCDRKDIEDAMYAVNHFVYQKEPMQLAFLEKAWTVIDKGALIGTSLICITWGALYAGIVDLSIEAVEGGAIVCGAGLIYLTSDVVAK